MWHGKRNRLIPRERYEVSTVSRYPEPLRKKEKMDKMYFSASLGSVYIRRFRCVTMDVLGVKSLPEHDFDG